MDFTVYDPSTDLIIRRGCVADAGQASLQARDGEGVLLGVQLSSATHKISLVDGMRQPVEIESPPPSIEDLKYAAKAAVAQRRWEIETGGVAFNGSTLATDDRSKILLAAAYSRSQSDPSFTTDWKTADGNWITLDASAIAAAYNAVFAWVDSSFAREAALSDLIDAAADAAAVAALAGTIQAFWPS